jgi:hypothetical protein
LLYLNLSVFFSQITQMNTDFNFPVRIRDICENYFSLTDYTDEHRF